MKDKREEKKTAHFYVIFSRPFCGDIFKPNSSILEKREKGKEKERKKEERSKKGSEENLISLFILNHIHAWLKSEENLTRLTSHKSNLI